MTPRPQQRRQDLGDRSGRSASRRAASPRTRRRRCWVCWLWLAEPSKAAPPESAEARIGCTAGPGPRHLGIVRYQAPPDLPGMAGPSRPLSRRRLRGCAVARRADADDLAPGQHDAVLAASLDEPARELLAIERGVQAAQAHQVRVAALLHDAAAVDH